MGTLQQCLKQCQDEASGDAGELVDEQELWKLEELRQISDRIKLRRHGPAIQMDVHAMVGKTFCVSFKFCSTNHVFYFSVFKKIFL